VLFCLPLPKIISQLQFPSLHSAPELFIISLVQTVWFKSKSKFVLKKKGPYNIYIHFMRPYETERTLCLPAQLLHSRALLFLSATLPSHFEQRSAAQKKPRCRNRKTTALTPSCCKLHPRTDPTRSPNGSFRGQIISQLKTSKIPTSVNKHESRPQIIYIHG